MFKKISITFYINIVCCVLSIAGLVVLLITNSVAGYSLSNGGAAITMGVLGIILVVAGTFTSVKFGSQSVFTVILKLAGLVCFGVAISLILLSRAELASSLFTWDSRNEVGWKAFSTAIGAIVIYFVTEIALIVCSFIGDRKEI